MQGWQDLSTQILVGVIVNAIIGILCWLWKREFAFFEKMLRVPYKKEKGMHIPMIRKKSQSLSGYLVTSSRIPSSPSLLTTTSHLIKKSL